MKKWKIILSISAIYLICTITFLQAQTYHIVSRGENLSFIASRYGCSIQQLKSWNNLRSNEIYAGQKLIVGNYTNKYYKVQWGDTLDSIASRYGVSVGWLERVNNIQNPYDLKIGQTLIVGQSEQQTYNPPIETNYTNYTNKYYKVQWGDTLDSIANRYGVSVGWLERVNNIQDPYALRMGQTLIVGQTHNQVYNNPPIETNYTNYTNKYYKVQWGDTLDSIANRYGVSVGWLERVNNIQDPYALRMGQTLIVGQTHNQVYNNPPIETNYTNYTNKYYKVQWGDTLDSIASRYGVSVGWLERVNNIQDPYALRMGQTLIVGQSPSQTYTPKETNNVETKSINPVINSSSVTYYQVKIGDTLISIAKKFNLDPNWLAKENLITDNQVTPGEIIVIPEVANKTAPSNTATSQSNAWNSNNFFSSIGHKIIQYADTFLGTPYVYGGTSRDGIDCSGLTQKVYKEMGINLPRTAAEQYRYGHPISLAEAQPGDLIFFHFGGYYVDHVGIYIGNNRFIQAGTYEGKVVISKLNSYLREHIAGVRTYFAENTENGNGG